VELPVTICIVNSKPTAPLFELSPGKKFAGFSVSFPLPRIGVFHPFEKIPKHIGAGRTFAKKKVPII
jgi:hypothetical protein